MKFSRKTFFDGYRAAFGALAQLQVDGLNFLLDKIEADPEWDSIQQIAYFLASIKHETGITRDGKLLTFQPIKEARASQGTSLRKSQDRYWLTGFYGRGFIQITWRENYEKFGIADDPAKALDPDFAYEIASKGMREGMFTGHKLSAYVNGHTDYKNARKVVNRLDKAELIAGYAEQFEEILARAEQQPEAVPEATAETEAKVEPPAPPMVAPVPPKAEAPKTESAVTVQKVAQSLGSKLVAGGTMVGTLATAIAAGFMGIIKNPFAFTLLILGGLAIAAYSWNESKKRALQLQLDLNSKAANPQLNTVVVVPPPTKSESA